MSVVGPAVFLAVALVPFMVGVATGTRLARVRWVPATAVIVGAVIALPFFLGEYQAGVNAYYDSIGPVGYVMALGILAGFVVWVLGIGAGAVIGRLLEPPAPKR